MQSTPQTPSSVTMSIPLEDYGQMQARYQSLPLAGRASAVLKDADPVLQAADEILKKISASHNIKQVFANIRKNAVIAGKMRPSDARNLLMDSSSDFIEGTLHKLAAWRKTMERISKGEDIVTENNREYIPLNAPLALAIAGTACVSNYLSIVQIAVGELAKTDAMNASAYRSTISDIRRCATILSDCENASGIAAVIH